MILQLPAVRGDTYPKLYLPARNYTQNNVAHSMKYNVAAISKGLQTWGFLGITVAPSLFPMILYMCKKL